MTQEEHKTLQELNDAYRILREAYHHDMHNEAPAKTDLELRVEAIIRRYKLLHRTAS